VKALVVDPDASRAAGVADALAGSGATATVAPSASFALTMLEWNRQDVIISRAQVGDMDGQEFCAMVRTDPSTKGVRFVLVANDVTPTQMAQIGIDLVIPEGLIGQAIVTRVMHLMQRDATPPAAVAAPPAIASTTAATAPPAPVPTPMASPPAAPVAGLPPVPEPPVVAPPAPLTLPAAAPAAPPSASPPIVPAPAEPAPTPPDPKGAPPASAPKGRAPSPPPLTELEAVGVNGAMRTFQGALGELVLEDLARAIAGGSKTGRLLLVLGTGGGMIAFDGGRIVHAEIGNTTGETAFQALVTASHRERGGKFCFIPSDPRDLANVPKTITRSVPDLLVGAARAMDEER
jgi:CheY-like chemotaxis protein